MGSRDLDFIACPKCGKKLIGRERNGLWHFIFGKAKKDGNNFIPVEMFIQGNIKIKCLRRTCGEWVILNYFPNSFSVQSVNKTEPDCAGKKQEIN
jgi:hypothetical protein